MKIVKITDIERLVKARFDYFDHDPSVPRCDAAALGAELRSYFEGHAGGDDFVALAVMEGDDIAAVGFLGIGAMPPSGSVPNGRLGTLYNILTYPRYRGKGYGRALVEAIVEQARVRGVSALNLYATEQGAGLYKKLGFVPLQYTAMSLKFEK